MRRELRTWRSGGSTTRASPEPGLHIGNLPSRKYDRFSCHDRKFLSLHRAIRYGVGDYDGVSRHRRQGSATLAVVAPGISEALVATAAGLAAAIPAVIFFNYFQNRIKKISAEMDNFACEFLNIIERYYVKL